MEKLYHIGRNQINNELFIIDDSISLSHAQVFIDKNIDLTIIDLSSKNGIFALRPPSKNQASHHT